VWARAAALAAVVVGVGFVPWKDNPFYRLAGGEGDGRDARFDAPLDPAILRDAGDTLPRGLPYAVVAPGESPLVQGNLKAAGQLYLAQALPVQDVSRAAARVLVDDGRIVLLRTGGRR
jgi:hypothetical protein